MKYYKYHISGSAHRFFPAETHFGIFTLEDNSKAEIPQEFPFGGAWGISSVDNVDLAAMGEVGITTYPHPMELLGKKASENLLRMIRDPFFDANYEFDADIVERDSVRRL